MDRVYLVIDDDSRFTYLAQVGPRIIAVANELAYSDDVSFFENVELTDQGMILCTPSRTVETSCVYREAYDEEFILDGFKHQCRKAWKALGKSTELSFNYF